MHKIVYLDTETTGLPTEGAGLEVQPHILSISIVVDMYNEKTREFTDVEEYELYNKEAGQYVTEEAKKVNGIDLDHLEKVGITQAEMQERVLKSLEGADLIVCHNTKFDMQLVWFDAIRAKNKSLVEKILTTRNFCTSINSRYFSINNKGGKHMKLVEVYKELNDGQEFDGQHNALADTLALRDIVRKMIVSGDVKPNQLTDTAKYTYINVQVKDGKFHSDASKIDIKNMHPIITRTAVDNTVDEMFRELLPFIDDSVVLFFTNKESLEDFNRMIAGTDVRSTFGFRLATTLDMEGKFDSLEMVKKHHEQHERKFFKPFQMMKDNGLYYR